MSHYRDKGIAVHRHVLWDYDHPPFRVWVLDCRYCDDSMEFATWRDAVEASQSHVARHKRERCSHCGAVPYVRYSEWP